MGTIVNWNSSNTRTLVHLIVAVESWMPYTKVEQDAYDKTVSLGGGCMKPFLDIIAKAAQASYELVVPARRGDWGTKLTNGSWTGIIGLLVDKKADIALGPYVNTYYRYQAADFGGIVDFSSTKFLTKFSTTGTADTNQKDMLLKLEGTDWKIFVCLLACWCLLPLACMAIENSFIEFHYYFDFIGIFCGQGLKTVSPKVGIRLVLASFLLATMVLSNYINGILHSSIVAKSNVKFIDSYNDLHKAATSSGLCPVFESGTAAVELFRNSGNPFLSDLLARSKSCKGFIRSPYEIHFIKRFNEEKLAYVGGDVGMMSQSRVFCDAYPKLSLHISSEGMFPATMGFLTTKTMNPHLKRILSRKAQVVFETGLMNMWVKSAEMEEGDVPCLKSFMSLDENSQEMESRLQDYKGVFQVWGTGLGLSWLLLCIEKVISSIKYRRSKAFNMIRRRNS